MSVTPYPGERDRNGSLAILVGLLGLMVVAVVALGAVSVMRGERPAAPVATTVLPAAPAPNMNNQVVVVVVPDSGSGGPESGITTTIPCTIVDINEDPHGDPHYVCGRLSETG